MTNKYRIERFKNEKIAIHCETEEEAKSFVKWCFNNGMRWRFGESTKTNFRFNQNKTCYTFDFSRDNAIEFCRKDFYEESGWEVIKYKDFMKEDKMTNLEYVVSEGLVKSKNGLCRIAHVCKYGGWCYGKKCPECEFNNDVNLCVQTLFQEHKAPIKLKQWEYDLLNAKRENYGNHYFGYHSDLRNMKNKGYFKDVADTSMPVAYILDNCEVVKDE